MERKSRIKRAMSSLRRGAPPPSARAGRRRCGGTGSYGGVPPPPRAPSPHEGDDLPVGDREELLPGLPQGRYPGKVFQGQEKADELVFPERQDVVQQGERKAEEVLEDQGGIGDVEPQEQGPVPVHVELDFPPAMQAGYGGTSLVPYRRPGLQDRFPARFPRPVRKIDVLQVERWEDRIEPPEAKQLLPVVEGGPPQRVEEEPIPVEAGKIRHFQRSDPEPAGSVREHGDRLVDLGSRIHDVRGDAEYRRVLESGQGPIEEVLPDEDVVVQGED